MFRSRGQPSLVKRSGIIHWFRRKSGINRRMSGNMLVKGKRIAI